MVKNLAFLKYIFALSLRNHVTIFGSKEYLEAVYWGFLFSLLRQLSTFGTGFSGSIWQRFGVTKKFQGHTVKMYRGSWYFHSNILDSLTAWLAGVQLNHVFLFPPSLWVKIPTSTVSQEWSKSYVKQTSELVIIIAIYILVWGDHCSKFVWRVKGGNVTMWIHLECNKSFSNQVLWVEGETWPVCSKYARW